MTTTTLISGDNQNNVTLTGGNDGTILLQTGVAGAKVSALSLDNSGNATVVGSLTANTASFTNARVLGQIVTYSTGAVATGTTIIPYDNTIPQNTEGDQYMSLSITPKNVNSLLEIEVIFVGTSSGATNLIVALFQDSAANAIATVTIGIPAAAQAFTIPLKHTITVGTVAATTFKVRAGSGVAGTTTFNGAASAQLFGGVASSRITIKEYLP